MKKTAKRNIAKVAGVAAALTLTASMGMSTVFASANISGNLSTNKKYESKYDSFNEVLQAGKELNYEIAAEGFVLMKNKDQALPLAKGERNVTVLGAAADSLAYGGGGSGGQGTPGAGKNMPGGADTSVAGSKATLFDSLEAAGFNANPRVRNRYLTVNPVSMPKEPSSFSTNTRESGHYMDLVESNGEVEFAGNEYKKITDGTGSLDGADGNYDLYNDAAIVVISRSGAEGADNPSHNVAGHADVNEHYLELDDAEKELIAYAKTNFEKIVVIINSPAAMELGCLEDDDGIGAILWVGQPGWNGIMAVGDILTGKINPSGRTVDFYMADFTTDPVWYNSTDYLQAAYQLYGKYEGEGIQGAPHTVTMGHTDAGTNDWTQEAMDYAEGIFMGYRYYETVAADLGDKGEEWYWNNVVYPYGYGLSYTTFSQEITEVKGDLSNADGKITVYVKVKNTGNVAGKEVVQLYDTAPYTAGGIDKAAVDLVGFTKTRTLKPGEAQTVSIELAVKDLAAFDYNDANKNDHFGYELDAGKYVLSIRKDSHRVLDTYDLSAAATLTWEEDDDADTPNNIYSQPVNSKWGQYNTLAHAWTESGVDHYLTRDKLVSNGAVGDLKQLSWLISGDGVNNVFKEEAFNVLDTKGSGYAYEDWDNATTIAVEDDYKNLWTKEAADIPTTWTQATGTADENGLYDITLYEMLGVPYDDAKWDEFMNQFTYEELRIAISSGRYSTVGVTTAGRPSVTDNDGPGQLKGRNNMGNGWAWCCAVVVASTWNTELAYKQGQITGHESIWLNCNGWYGPAMNTHRSPLAGRNFEYYSQDGVQGGKIAANVVKGYTDMGGHVYIKHAFLNDQETNRLDTATFATEQAIRQIYAKPFELCIREGNANGTMSAFNLIGIESSVSYATAVQLYRNEWGFEGYSVTDMWSATNYGYKSGWTGWGMARGYTQPLGDNRNTNAGMKIEGTWDAEQKCVMVNDKDNNPVKSYTQWYYVRETAKAQMFTIVNSSAMRGGINAWMYTPAAKNVGLGEAISGNIFTDAQLEALNGVFGNSGYKLTVTGLPAGVNVNASGVLSGTPTAMGTSTVSVTIKGDMGLGYIADTASFKLTVGAGTSSDKITLSEAAKTATAGVAYTATPAQTLIITSGENANYVAGGQANAANVDKFTAYNWAATGLPIGLTVDKTTGEISGTPAQSGTFNVVLTLNATQVYKNGNRYSTRNVVNNYYLDLTVAASTDTSLKTVNLDLGNKNTVKLTVADGAALKTVLTGYTVTDANGHKLLGWSATANGAVIEDLADVVFAASGATTLYAVYEIPQFEIINGYWYIGGVNTGVRAEGTTGATGSTGATGADGADGADGVDGVSIVKAEIVDGELILTYSNGTVTNLGNVVGADGENGAPGQPGAPGEKGDKGDAGSGCGGNIASTAGIAALAMALIAAGVIVSRKRNSGK